MGEVTPEKRAASSHSSSDYDAEKAKTSAGKTNVNPVNFNDGINRDLPIVRKLWAAVQWLDRFGVEARGVERVPEDERHHHRVADAGFMWGSANCTISTFALGFLGQSVFGLGLADSALVILFFNLLCTLPVALFSAWGKSTGLRQMIMGRFAFGFNIWFPTLLNCIACVGWSTINSIAGASALRAVSNDHPLPEAAGIVIIAVITLAVALFGYEYVHFFERWASLPVIIIFLILLGQTAPWAQGGFGPLTGRDEAGAVLSFGAAIAGFALGWTSLAGDYTVNFPVETPSTKVFAYTYIGLNFPLILVETFGAVAFASLANKDTWQEAYDTYGVGGLLGAPLYGPMGGFGRLLLVILALSIVANNIPNVYSFALSVQALHKYFQLIPRCFLSVLCTGIYIALAIPGADHFESWLDTMLVILSYWLAIYTGLLIEGHYIFRGGKFSNWNLEASYNDFSKLPPGWAAAIAVIAGVAGAVLGMAQEWYVGVIGGMITMPFGGDIGFLLSFSFAGIIYPPVRYLERRIHGR